MADDFTIGTTWEAAETGSDEIRLTASQICISVNGKSATRAQDDWSQTVVNAVRVPAFPLAQWFAANWWRLRWEPEPVAGSGSHDWRMAHEMRAAGYGFVWPRLIFESDGETIGVTCLASKSNNEAEPLHYLNNFRETVSARRFERGIDKFIDLVLARLTDVGLNDSALRSLWQEIKAERADPEAAAFRKLEARLGFDPDQAPETVIARLLSLMDQAGPSAVDEIAAACAGSDVPKSVESVVAMASQGTEGEIDPVLSGANVNRAAKPWEHGRAVARDVRQRIGMGTRTVSNQDLAGLLGVSADILYGHGRGSAPIGLAVRGVQPNRLRYNFRKANPPGRRFEAARFLADHITAGPEDRWLPVADTKTARQKLQRAFAAEFLCPIDALKDFLGDDRSDDAVEEAGFHFDISPLAVKSHLANNGLLPGEVVGWARPGMIVEETA